MGIGEDPPLPQPSDIELIVCDVNGTLLGSDQRIQDDNLFAFLKLRKKCPNLPIVLTSGSLYKRCQWIRDALKLPIHFPSMHCNGTLIYGGPNGTLLKSYGVDPEAVQYIVENTQTYGAIIWKEHEGLLVNPGKGINAKDWVSILAGLGKIVLDHTREPERSMTIQAVLNETITAIKVNICADESAMDAGFEEMTALHKGSPHPYKIIRSIDPFMFAVNPANIDKSTAALEICRIEKVDPKKVLVFGDRDNDSPLFKSLGYSVAMGNATPKSKAAAMYIVSSNDKGGVGEFLSRVWDLS